MKSGATDRESRFSSRPFLEGELISLVPMEPTADAEPAYRWLNDPEVTYFMFYGQRPLNLEQTRKFLESQNSEAENMVFTITDKKNGSKIGLAGLYGIDWISRRCEYRILIGEKSAWGRGYGTEVTELLTWFGFDRLNMNRIDLGVTALNEGAIKAYRHAGYEHEFARKDYMYRNGCYYDVSFMTIFRTHYDDKFSAKHKKRFGGKDL